MNMEKHYPELKALSSRKEREDMLRLARTELLLSPGYISRFIVAILFVLLYSVFCIYFSLSTNWFYLPTIAILFYGPLSISLTRNSVRRNLRTRLWVKGIRFCEKCGYDLRSISDSICPECGIQFYEATGNPVDNSILYKGLNKK